MPAALLLPSLLFALGCNGEGGGGSSYQLHVVPVLPRNQPDLLSGLDRLSLTIAAPGEDPVTLDVEDLATGDETRFDEIGSYEAATLTLEGFVGSDVVAWGQSEPTDLVEGEIEVRILVAQVDALAELAPLGAGRALAALAADDSGRFLLFGGSPEGTRPTELDGRIQALDVAPAGSDLAFSELDLRMPPLDNGDPGRICHTATTLRQGGHERVGRILVTGGASGIIVETGGGPTGSLTVDASTVSISSFLFDPAGDTVQALSESSTLIRERCMHTATELPSGEVVVIGGIGDSASGWVFEQSAEIFDPNAGGFELANGTTSGPAIFHAAAALGDDGVLACGGMDISGATEVTASDACDFVSRAGEITAMEDLPVPLIHAAMAPLPDGTVLLTGGIDVEGGSDTIYGFSGATALANAWIFDGEQWTETESMAVPRAMHQMVALDNGDVLIVGGVTEIDGGLGLIYASEAAIACAEVYDAQTGRFRTLGSCEPDAGVGALPMAAAAPSVAVDPTWGAMVTGGLNMDEIGASGVSLYVP